MIVWKCASWIASTRIGHGGFWCLTHAGAQKNALHTHAPQPRDVSWQELKEALASAVSAHATSHALLRRLHGRILSSGLGSNLHLCRLLITRYSSFRDLDAAFRVFDVHCDSGPTKTLIWNSLMRGCLANGEAGMALEVYHDMVRVGSAAPDSQTYHLAISACADLSEIEIGMEIADDAQSRMLDSDLLVGTALVKFYCRKEELAVAVEVFDRMTQRDVVLWNSMISGFCKSGCLSDAMVLLRRMRVDDGIGPAEATLVSLISASGDLNLLMTGEGIHALVVRCGFESNLFVVNSLMKMYIECECLYSASRLFHGLLIKDAVTWSTMIGGFYQDGCPCVAMALFNKMVSRAGILPTRPILLNVLLACADLGDWVLCKSVLQKYLMNNENDYRLDICLSTAVVYMYAKCSRIDISLELLNEVPLVRNNTIAWNVLIKACAEVGDVYKASEVARQMQRRGIHPDSATFLVLLTLCLINPFLHKGLETHTHVIKRGFHSERPISNALIGMYAGIGNIQDSFKIFHELKDKDVVSWTSMIRAYSQNGKGDEALGIFEQMMHTAIKPNSITFVAVLSGCSHAGNVEKGMELFQFMKEVHFLQPTLEHYACIVDLLCRAGLLTEACGFLENEISNSCNYNAVLWGSLLSACRQDGNCLIGEVAAKKLFHLEPRNTANYKMLVDIYVSVGRIEDANTILRSLEAKDHEKTSGCSCLNDC